MAVSIDTYTTTLAAVRGSTLFAPDDRFLSGGRILLPQKCLGEISRLSVVYPLQFKVTLRASPQREEKEPKYVYAAVLEFTAERGMVVLPDWMADYLGLPPALSSSAMRSIFVDLQTCNLGGANTVKLQPHSSNFISLSDPREVLERQLLNYPVLMVGTSIIVRHAKTDFLIRIVSLLDHRNREVEAVLSARADLQATEVKVEFEPPMDSLENEEEEEEVLWAPQVMQRERLVRSGTGSEHRLSSSGGRKGNATSESASSISFSYPTSFQPPTIDALKAVESRQEGKGIGLGSSLGAKSKVAEERTSADKDSANTSAADASFTPFVGQGRTLATTTPPLGTTSMAHRGNGGILSSTSAHSDRSSSLQRRSPGKRTLSTRNGAPSSDAPSTVPSPEQVRAARLKWLQQQSADKK